MSRTMILSEYAVDVYKRAEAERERQRQEAEAEQEKQRELETWDRFNGAVRRHLERILDGSVSAWEVVHHERGALNREVIYVRPEGDEGLTLAWVFRGDGGHLDLAYWANDQVGWQPCNYGNIRSLEDLGRALIEHRFAAGEDAGGDGS